MSLRQVLQYHGIRWYPAALRYRSVCNVSIGSTRSTCISAKDVPRNASLYCAIPSSFVHRGPRPARFSSMHDESGKPVPLADFARAFGFQGSDFPVHASVAPAGASANNTVTMPDDHIVAAVDGVNGDSLSQPGIRKQAPVPDGSSEVLEGDEDLDAQYGFNIPDAYVARQSVLSPSSTQTSLESPLHRINSNAARSSFAADQFVRPLICLFLCTRLFCCEWCAT